MTDACRDRWYAPASGGDPQDNDIVRLGFNACQCRHSSEHIPFEVSFFSGSQVFRASLPVTSRCLDQGYDNHLRRT
jgi:hypothetical protein